MVFKGCVSFKYFIDLYIIMDFSASKNAQKRIAVERIRTLFREAEGMFDKRPDLCQRYIELAKKISLKYKVAIPDHFKRRMCKKCYSFLIPGKTCRIRTHQGKLVYFCIGCKSMTRVPIKK